MAKDISISDHSRLPAMINEAAQRLSIANGPAEILVAREVAGTAYDVAKRVARLALATSAHEQIVRVARRAQADALEIEFAADQRLAAEIDLAQADGAMSRGGRPPKNGMPPANTVKSHGLSRKELFLVRQIRNQIRMNPKALRLALNELLEEGFEPTRALLRKEILGVRQSVRTRDKDQSDIASPRSPIYPISVEKMAVFEIPIRIQRLRVEIHFFELIKSRLGSADALSTVGACLSHETLAEAMRQAEAIDAPRPNEEVR